MMLKTNTVLDEAGNVDVTIVYDQMQSGYYTIGEKAGQAWETGKALMTGTRD